MPDRMDAFGTVRTGMESSRARMTRSVCVVALRMKISLVTVRWQFRNRLPKGISNDKEGNIFFLGIAQDLVAVRFNHLAVGDCY